MPRPAPDQARSPKPSPSAERSRVIESALLAFFIALATLVAFIVSATDSAPAVLYEQNRIDPLVFRAVGNLLSSDRSPYSVENQLQDIAQNRLDGNRPPYAIPFSYPPNALPLFHLRTLGDPQWNAALHAAAFVLAAMLGLALLLYRYVDNHVTRLVIVFVAAFWTPSLLDIELAQTGHLAGALAFSFLLCHDRRPLLAGIALGLLAFKPQYAIPLGLVALARQHWPLLVAAGVTFLATCLVSAALYGMAQWPEFWRSASAFNSTIFHMESWLGVAALLLPDHLAAIHELALPVYGGGMFLLGLALWQWRDKLDLLAATSLAILTTLLLSPNTHPYDLSLFFIPLLLFTRHFGMRMWFAELAFLVFLIPNIFVTVSVLRLCFLVLCLILLLAIIWRGKGPAALSGN